MTESTDHILLVGGPADGKLIPAPGFPFKLRYANAQADGKIHYTHYRVEDLACTRRVGVHESLYDFTGRIDLSQSQILEIITRGATDPDHDPINHPKHYSDNGVGFECIELSRRATFDVGNAIKYMWRSDHKNGIEDVKKARWYVNDAIANDDHQTTSFLLQDRRDYSLLCTRVAESQPEEHRRLFWFALSDFALDEALVHLDAIIQEES